MHRLIFFAVLEGCYRDGVSNEAVDLILPKNPDTGGVVMEHNFVYSCPLCMPVIEALRTYRVRTRFFDKRARDTFGKGLPAEVMAKLAEPERKKRIPVLQALVSGWVKRRCASATSLPMSRVGMIRKSGCRSSSSPISLTSRKRASVVLLSFARSTV